MSKIFRLACFLVCLIIGLPACGSSNLGGVEEDSLSQIFEQHDIPAQDATLIIQRLSDNRRWVVNTRRKEQRFLPASTSKIPHTLIALETGIATPDTVFKWDGRKRHFDAWNQDQTLRSAYKRSAAWLYQRLVGEIGAADMRAWLGRFNYGNYHTITDHNVDNYWLTGPLKVSAEEQVAFLTRLSSESLPLSEQTYKAARTMFKETETGTHSLFAKTGWKHNPTEMDIGWYVGWTEDSSSSEKFVFAFNMDMPNQGDQNKRKPIVMEALQAVGGWPE